MPSAHGCRPRGLGKSDPVVLFLNNCPQCLITYFGIQKIGAIVCPCGPLNKAHELGYQLRDLQARAIVAASTLVPIVGAVRADSALQHGFVVHYTDLLPAAPSLDLPADLQPRDLEAIGPLARAVGPAAEPAAVPVAGAASVRASAR